jgi:FlaA1/EpsC-like NDP-sugar epimerase
MENRNQNLSREFRGKNILITGGTGSIGLGIVKQLTKYRPKEIRILSNDENSIVESIENLGKNSIYKFMVGDVRDKDRLNLAIRDIDIVYHAAAMKHIDICESNPFDAVKTNVVGTSNILEASIIEGVKKFIFISTDKATNPTSTLGGSKLLAERLTLDASTYVKNGRTKFAIVRFGNVIGSRGSVFQIFQNQIKMKKPLTVTDKRMTRFIMSISEASSMILKVTKIMKDGETFVLKMPSVRIEDLAKGMLRVYGARFPIYRNTSPIKISKSRERERFNEFLITNEELPFCHGNKGMYKISKTVNGKKLSMKEFSSETAPRISQSKLYKTINELIDEYISY